METIDDPILTTDEARRIIAPVFDALNRPSEKDVSALLAEACHDDYRSYHTNEDFRNREELADLFRAMGAVVPDLRWEVLDLRVAGDQIIVRGRVSGTPASEFFGAAPTGKSFHTMAVDILTVRQGKLSSAYHAENWTAAIQQIAA